MAGITLVQAEELLAASIESYKATLISQEYEKADRSLKRAMLKDLLAAIDSWDAKVKSLSAGDGSGKMQVRKVIPYV